MRKGKRQGACNESRAHLFILLALPIGPLIDYCPRRHAQTARLTQNAVRSADKNCQTGPAQVRPALSFASLLYTPVKLTYAI